jgi:hypothetical protein
MEASKNARYLHISQRQDETFSVYRRKIFKHGSRLKAAEMSRLGEEDHESSNIWRVTQEQPRD